MTRDKKKKRKKKWGLIILLLLLLLCILAAGGWYLFRTMNREESLAEQITAGEGEELVYARITGIVGNEVEAAVVVQKTEGQEADAGGSGTPTDGSGMPTGGNGMPSDSLQAAQSSYTQTGETVSWQIPVGTQVITRLGVVTSFSRLSADDVIAVLLEKGTDNILRIQVVE